MDLKVGAIFLLLSMIALVAQADTPATEQSQLSINQLQIGSCYGGGVVFYISNQAASPGQRGLIVALADVDGTVDGMLIQGCNDASNGNPATCVFDTTGHTQVNYTSGQNPYTYFSGQNNTKDIIATPTNGIWSAAQAANAYKTKNSQSDCQGCTHWYLPSQEELNTFYAQSLSMENFGQSCPGYESPNPVAAYPYYVRWSSSQMSGNPYFAWIIDFSDGFVFNLNTSIAFPVRAVRAF